MKMLAIGSVLLVCLGVTACATPRARGVAHQRGVDVGKMVTVNEWAMRRHATVVWINPPQRRERGG